MMPGGTGGAMMPMGGGMMPGGMPMMPMGGGMVPMGGTMMPMGGMMPMMPMGGMVPMMMMPTPMAMGSASGAGTTSGAPKAGSPVPARPKANQNNKKEDIQAFDPEALKRITEEAARRAFEQREDDRHKRSRRSRKEDGMGGVFGGHMAPAASPMPVDGIASPPPGATSGGGGVATGGSVATPMGADSDASGKPPPASQDNSEIPSASVVPEDHAEEQAQEDVYGGGASGAAASHPGGGSGDGIADPAVATMGGANSGEARRLDMARKAALEIQASLNEPKDLSARPQGVVHMGVCIHWNCRGFGILRSKTVGSATMGEVFVHVKALKNCEELTVGDVVTFEMGFDQRKQKPQALNCVKAGGGSQVGLQSGGDASGTCVGGGHNLDAAPVIPTMQQATTPALMNGPSGATQSGSNVDDALIKGAAAAAALKLLTQGRTQGAPPPLARSASRSRSRVRRGGGRKQRAD